jgi:hypothetical protein
MPIGVRSWEGLLTTAKMLGLKVYEPDNRLDFFVYIVPDDHFPEEGLRSNYHLHIFLESNIKEVNVGEVVSIRIATILPKTAFICAERPTLAEKEPDDWIACVSQMKPKCTATEEAARRFAEIVKSQLARHENAGEFVVMK